MSFRNGISAWSLTGVVKPEHDHVGVLVPIDGDRAHTPGAWDCMDGTMNADVQDKAFKDVVIWLNQGKNVVIRLVGWRGPAPENVTQHGLYTWDGNPNRTGANFCLFLKSFLAIFGSLPRDRLRIEPFSEMGFMPDCTTDRSKAVAAWQRAIGPIFTAIQEVLPGVEVIVGTPAYDACTGSFSGFPCTTGTLDPLMIVPCHFYEPRTPLYRFSQGYRWGMNARIIDKVIASQPQPDVERWLINDEFDGLPWNYTGLLASLQVYKSECLRMGTRPYVGECGMCEPGTPPASVAKYNAELGMALDALGLDRCWFSLNGA